MSSLKKKFKVDEQVFVKVISWTIGKSSQKGTKFVRIKFTKGISWTGYFTDATTERVMKTLEDLGFKGRNLAMLAEENALDTENEFIAVIQESREYEGKTYYDAKWINKAYSKGFNAEKVDQSIMREFEEMDTRAYIEGATDISKPAAADDMYSSSFSESDIPF
jgi:hypothetical protein